MDYNYPPVVKPPLSSISPVKLKDSFTLSPNAAFSKASTYHAVGVCWLLLCLVVNTTVNKTVFYNMILRRIHATTVAVEKQ